MLLLFAIQNIQAQTHQMGANYNCKLKKGNGNTEGYPCEACTAKDKKEKDAKIAEDKRRFAAAQAEAEAKKAASEKVRLAKLAETEKNAESGKVYINGNKNTVSTSSSAQPKLAKNVTDNTIMVAIYNSYTLVQGFENEKKEILVKNNEWKETKTFSEISMTVNCPKNLGVVRLGDSYFNQFKDYTYHYDIVNSKGEYLFNDKNIRSIYYINDGWLLIGVFESYNYYLYNLNTKNKILLNNLAGEDYKQLFGCHIFLPIFSETTKLGFWVEHMAEKSKLVKNNLLEWAPSKISEEMLSKYSFALVHTNYGYASHYSGRHKSGYDASNTVILYCITKNGELEVINLK